jgi:transposase
MLADQLDYVIGVDPHRDVHALAVVEVRTGGVVYEAAVAASTAGYRRALELAEEYAAGRRAFAVEGSGSFGAGLTRFLTGRGERIFEVGRLRRERRCGGKTDALDAVRAARVVLSQTRPAQPRAGGRREALRALMAAREGAVNARRGRRIEHLTAEERELAREIETLTRELAPHLLNEPGVGPLAAAQLLLSWSHPGRVRSEAAFARLGGCAPIPASSGQTIRYRLDRSGDRQLNRALHMILINRRRWHQPTIDYIARRRQDGKTTREASRCLKRYLARNLYRLLEHPPPST